MLDSIFGMTLRTKANFFRQLATMIDSGMPILGCLEALGKTPNPTVQEIIRRLIPLVQEGTSLSDAFSRMPRHFDEMTIMMIRAGEVGGHLEDRLLHIADYLERMHNQQQHLISKLIYPIILIHAGIFIPTLPVLFLGGGIIGYLQRTLIPLLFMYAVVIGFYFLYRSLGSMPGFREGIDGFFAYFPFIGNFFRSRAVYRFVLVLGELTDAGVDMDSAIKTAADACGNAAIRARLYAAADGIMAGQTLGQCLAGTGIFPASVLHMIQTGEQSGSLPGMLRKTAELLEIELNEAMNRTFTILPVLFYFMIAIYVGYTLITTFAKIYAPLNDLFPK